MTSKEKENVHARTKSSNQPDSKNANYLERICIPARLPIDTLFCPQLVLKVFPTFITQHIYYSRLIFIFILPQVYDSKLGGLRESMLASCVIDLTKKLPWSPDYSPPQQQEFDYHMEVAKKAKIAKRKNTSQDTATESKVEEVRMGSLSHDSNKAMGEESESESESEASGVDEMNEKNESMQNVTSLLTGILVPLSNYVFTIEWPIG